MFFEFSIQLYLDTADIMSNSPHSSVWSEHPAFNRRVAGSSPVGGI